MRPELMYGVVAYPALLVLGIGVGVVLAVYWMRRMGVRVGDTGLAAVLLLLVAALLGAKLDSLIERGLAFNGLAEWSRGYRYPGGVLGLLAAIPLVAWLAGSGRAALALGDALMPAFGGALAVVRAGCFLAGCCHGAPTDAWWAVRFPAGGEAWHRHVDHGWQGLDAAWSLPVHPLQLYFAAGSLAIAGLAAWALPRRAWAGQVLLLCLGLDALLKFALEGLRDPVVPHLRWVPLTIAAAAACGLLAVELRRRARRCTPAGEPRLADGSRA